MAKAKRSRNQKRKDKLAKKNRRIRPSSAVLPYHGEKYRTVELVPLWMETEIAIFETFVITEHKLLDQTVADAMETLIKQLRVGTFSPSTDTSDIHYEIGNEEDLLIEHIRRRWAAFFDEKWQPPRSKLIGVLRTMLGTIETMRTASPKSQSYLRHIIGFLTKKMGVTVKPVSADMEPLPEPEEDELIVIGREWAFDGDLKARAEFFELADEVMNDGKQKRVIDACHQLIGELSDPESEAVDELVNLSWQAQQSMVAAIE